MGKQEKKKSGGNPADSLLRHLHVLTGIDIIACLDGELKDSPSETAFSPVRKNGEFRDRLLTRTEEQKVPVVDLDRHDVVIACIRSTPAKKGEEGGLYYFLGPVACSPMNRVELHRYYRDCGYRGKEEPGLLFMSLPRFLLAVQLAAGILTGKEFSMQELLTANGLSDRTPGDSPEHRRLTLSMDEEVRESAHHTYEEERKLLAAVSEGRAEDAIELTLSMDEKMGTVSATYADQAKRTAVIGITLCTRAAIFGGVSPSAAYQISDFYLQRLDFCLTPAKLLSVRNEAITALCEKVAEKQGERKVSGYVEAACEYIDRHYREKLYLSEIAEKMGITPTYLSHLFSEEKQMTLQEYIVKVRVERAANLLTYSEASIAEIGDYVNFPSQSYFGRVFKKYTGMTPGQYRKARKPACF